MGFFPIDSAAEQSAETSAEQRCSWFFIPWRTRGFSIGNDKLRLHLFSHPISRLTDAVLLKNDANFASMAISYQWIMRPIMEVNQGLLSVMLSNACNMIVAGIFNYHFVWNIMTWTGIFGALPTMIRFTRRWGGETMWDYSYLTTLSTLGNQPKLALILLHLSTVLLCSVWFSITQYNSV